MKYEVFQNNKVIATFRERVDAIRFAWLKVGWSRRITPAEINEYLVVLEGDHEVVIQRNDESVLINKLS